MFVQENSLIKIWNNNITSTSKYGRGGSRGTAIYCEGE